MTVVYLLNGKPCMKIIITMTPTKALNIVNKNIGYESFTAVEVLQ